MSSKMEVRLWFGLLLSEHHVESQAHDVSS